jgi:negative regulator of replication initiation
MMTIEVDFEVYKELTYRRKTEEETNNDVLREALSLPAATKPCTAGEPWVVKRVSFAHGTLFEGTHKGKTYRAEVREGQLWFNGKPYATPSGAAYDAIGGKINGWTFWRCRRPGESSFIQIDAYRRKK